MNHHLNKLVKSVKFRDLRAKAHSIISRGYRDRELNQFYAYVTYRRLSRCKTLDLCYNFPYGYLFRRMDRFKKLRKALTHNVPNV